MFKAGVEGFKDLFPTEWGIWEGAKIELPLAFMSGFNLHVRACYRASDVKEIFKIPELSLEEACVGKLSYFTNSQVNCH